MNRKKTQRLYREEGQSMRRRLGRKHTTGTRTPILTAIAPNARWSVGFVVRLASRRPAAAHPQRGGRGD
nr:hypothetical protein [Halovulum marinum]